MAAPVPDPPTGALSHFDGAGQAHMVDVAAKGETHRIARAGGTIRMRAETLALIESGSAKKGDVLGIARIAAIQGAKRTADLVPLCHPIAAHPRRRRVRARPRRRRGSLHRAGRDASAAPASRWRR